MFLGIQDPRITVCLCVCNSHWSEPWRENFWFQKWKDWSIGSTVHSYITEKEILFTIHFWYLYFTGNLLLLTLIIFLMFGAGALNFVLTKLIPFSCTLVVSLSCSLSMLSGYCAGIEPSKHIRVTDGSQQQYGKCKQMLRICPCGLCGCCAQS